jgi:RHS repeat-associated protein
VLERYVYDPYGQATVLTGTYGARASSLYGWRYLHQGGRLDPATGLYHFRNRDYSASLGRWVSNDPLGFGAGDVNLYRAYGNGPGNSVDPFGLEDISAIARTPRCMSCHGTGVLMGRPFNTLSSGAQQSILMWTVMTPSKRRYINDVATRVNGAFQFAGAVGECGIGPGCAKPDSGRR